jgi:crotonobetainyl-CoA:carnitine CoA-transferase CaiB-like acyl-CoA transferase
MFPAADGFVTVAAQEQPFFQVLCEATDAHDLLEDPRFGDSASRSAHRHALIEALSVRMRRFTKVELGRRLGGRIPFGPVMGIADIERDPHFAARNMIVEVEQPGAAPIRVAGVPIKMTESPGAVRRRSPFLGEDTRAELRRAGLSEDEIQGLLDRGAAIASDTEENAT